SLGSPVDSVWNPGASGAETSGEATSGFDVGLDPLATEADAATGTGRRSGYRFDVPTPDATAFPDTTSSTSSDPLAPTQNLPSSTSAADENASTTNAGGIL
ncbi:MAG: hypothetical protein IJX36_06015, partial [Thermoguttaceae bacterium]|nr:hypothetical protein [Thermoguttaceae bacterium]